MLIYASTGTACSSMLLYPSRLWHALNQSWTLATRYYAHALPTYANENGLRARAQRYWNRGTLCSSSPSTSGAFPCGCTGAHVRLSTAARKWCRRSCPCSGPRQRLACENRDVEITYKVTEQMGVEKAPAITWDLQVFRGMSAGKGSLLETRAFDDIRMRERPMMQSRIMALFSPKSSGIFIVPA